MAVKVLLHSFVLIVCFAVVIANNPPSCPLQEDSTEPKQELQWLIDRVCLNYNTRTYVANHLNDKKIIIDGKMDELAWEEVEWSEPFTDIRGDNYPPPEQLTRLKMRWDNEQLYILAWMEETEKDDPMPNTLQVMCNTDKSMHNYKEIQVDTNGAKFDRMFRMSPMDIEDKKLNNHPTWKSASTVAPPSFELNGSSGKGVWLIEMAIPFTTLGKHHTETSIYPKDRHVWFFNAARRRSALDIEKEKAMAADGGWWPWQPMYTENMYIPSRFGYVQFRESKSDKFQFDDRVYKSLFTIFESQKRYKASAGVYAKSIDELDLTDARCFQGDVKAAIISANQTHFEAEVKMSTTKQIGRIMQDRRVSVSEA